MKRLLAFLALCLPLYLFAQGFGSFSHDQPFFARNLSSAAVDLTYTNNLVLWVKADAKVTNSAGNLAADGDYVSAWGDSGTNSYHLRQAGGDTRRPKYSSGGGPDGKPCLIWETAGDEACLTNKSTTSYGQTNTYVFVIKLGASSATYSNPNLMDSQDATDRQSISMLQGPITRLYSGLVLNAGTNTISTNDWVILTCKFHDQLVGDKSFFETNSITKTMYPNDDAGSKSMKGITIGQYQGGGTATAFRGRIAEILWYKGTIPTAGLDNVEAYLSYKYGIPIY